MLGELGNAVFSRLYIDYCIQGTLTPALSRRENGFCQTFDAPCVQKGVKHRGLTGFALAVFGSAVVTCCSAMRCDLVRRKEIAAAVQNPCLLHGPVLESGLFYRVGS